MKKRSPSAKDSREGTSSPVSGFGKELNMKYSRSPSNLSSGSVSFEDENPVRLLQVAIERTIQSRHFEGTLVDQEDRNLVVIFARDELFRREADGDYTSVESVGIHPWIYGSDRQKALLRSIVRTLRSVLSSMSVLGYGESLEALHVHYLLVWADIGHFPEFERFNQRNCNLPHELHSKKVTSDNEVSMGDRMDFKKFDLGVLSDEESNLNMSAGGGGISGQLFSSLSRELIDSEVALTPVEELGSCDNVKEGFVDLGFGLAGLERESVVDIFAALDSGSEASDILKITRQGKAHLRGKASRKRRDVVDAEEKRLKAMLAENNLIGDSENNVQCDSLPSVGSLLLNNQGVVEVNYDSAEEVTPAGPGSAEVSKGQGSTPSSKSRYESIPDLSEINSDSGGDECRCPTSIGVVAKSVADSDEVPILIEVDSDSDVGSLDSTSDRKSKSKGSSLTDNARKRQNKQRTATARAKAVNDARLLNIAESGTEFDKARVLYIQQKLASELAEESRIPSLGNLNSSDDDSDDELVPGLADLEDNVVVDRLLGVVSPSSEVEVLTDDQSAVSFLYRVAKSNEITVVDVIIPPVIVVGKDGMLPCDMYEGYVRRVPVRVPPGNFRTRSHPRHLSYLRDICREAENYERRRNWILLNSDMSPGAVEQRTLRHREQAISNRLDACRKERVKAGKVLDTLLKARLNPDQSDDNIDLHLMRVYQTIQVNRLYYVRPAPKVGKEAVAAFAERLCDLHTGPCAIVYEPPVPKIIIRKGSKESTIRALAMKQKSDADRAASESVSSCNISPAEVPVSVKSDTGYKACVSSPSSWVSPLLAKFTERVRVPTATLPVLRAPITMAEIAHIESIFDYTSPITEVASAAIERNRFLDSRDCNLEKQQSSCLKVLESILQWDTYRRMSDDEYSFAISESLLYLRAIANRFQRMYESQNSASHCDLPPPRSSPVALVSAKAGVVADDGVGQGVNDPNCDGGTIVAGSPLDTSTLSLPTPLGELGECASPDAPQPISLSLSGTRNDVGLVGAVAGEDVVELTVPQACTLLATPTKEQLDRVNIVYKAACASKPSTPTVRNSHSKRSIVRGRPEEPEVSGLVSDKWNEFFYSRTTSTPVEGATPSRVEDTSAGTNYDVNGAFTSVRDSDELRNDIKALLLQHAEMIPETSRDYLDKYIAAMFPNEILSVLLDGEQPSPMLKVLLSEEHPSVYATHAPSLPGLDIVALWQLWDSCSSQHITDHKSSLLNIVELARVVPVNGVGGAAALTHKGNDPRAPGTHYFCTGKAGMLVCSVGQWCQMDQNKTQGVVVYTHWGAFRFRNTVDTAQFVKDLETAASMAPGFDRADIHNFVYRSKARVSGVIIAQQLRDAELAKQAADEAIRVRNRRESDLARQLAHENWVASVVTSPAGGGSATGPQDNLDVTGLMVDGRRSNLSRRTSLSAALVTSMGISQVQADIISESAFMMITQSSQAPVVPSSQGAQSNGSAMMSAGDDASIGVVSPAQTRFTRSTRTRTDGLTCGVAREHSDGVTETQDELRRSTSVRSPQLACRDVSTILRRSSSSGRFESARRIATETTHSSSPQGLPAVLRAASPGLSAEGEDPRPSGGVSGGDTRPVRSDGSIRPVRPRVLANGVSSDTIVDLCTGQDYGDCVVTTLSLDELTIEELAYFSQMRTENDQFHRGELLRLAGGLSNRDYIHSPVWECNNEDAPFFDRKGPVESLEARCIAAVEDVQLLDICIARWEGICAASRSIPRLRQFTPLQEYGLSGLSEIFPRPRRATVLEFLCEKVADTHTCCTDSLGLPFAGWERDTRSLIQAMQLHESETTALVVEEVPDVPLAERSSKGTIQLLALPYKTPYSLCIHQRLTEILQMYLRHILDTEVPGCLVSVRENERLETLIHIHANAQSGLRLLVELKRIHRYSTWLEECVRIVHRNERSFGEHRFHVAVGASDYDTVVGDNPHDGMPKTTTLTGGEASGLGYLEMKIINQRRHLVKEAAIALIATAQGNSIRSVGCPLMDVLNEVSVHDVFIGLMGNMRSEGTDGSSEVSDFIDYVMRDLNLIGGFREGIRGVFSKKLRSLVRLGVHGDDRRRAVLDSHMRSTLVAHLATNLLMDRSMLTLSRDVVRARTSDFTNDAVSRRRICEGQAAYGAADVMHETIPTTGHLKNFFEYEMAIIAVYACPDLGSNQLAGVYGDVAGPLGACQITARWMVKQALQNPVRCIYDNIRIVLRWILTYAKRHSDFDIRSGVKGLCKQLGLSSALGGTPVTYLQACVRLQATIPRPTHTLIMAEWAAEMKMLLFQSQFANLNCPRLLALSIATPVMFGPDDIRMQSATSTLLRSLLAGGGDVMQLDGVANEQPITESSEDGMDGLEEAQVMMIIWDQYGFGRHRRVPNTVSADASVSSVQSDERMCELGAAKCGSDGNHCVINSTVTPVLPVKSDEYMDDQCKIESQSDSGTPKRKILEEGSGRRKRLVTSYKCASGRHFTIDSHARSSPWGIRMIDFDELDDGSVDDGEQERFDDEIERSLVDQYEAADYALMEKELEKYLKYLEDYAIAESRAVLGKSVIGDGSVGSPLPWIFGQVEPSLADLQMSADIEEYDLEYHTMSYKEWYYNHPELHSRYNTPKSPDSDHSGMFVDYPYYPHEDESSSVESPGECAESMMDTQQECIEIALKEKQHLLDLVEDYTEAFSRRESLRPSPASLVKYYGVEDIGYEALKEVIPVMYGEVGSEMDDLYMTNRILEFSPGDEIVCDSEYGTPSTDTTVTSELENTFRPSAELSNNIYVGIREYLPLNMQHLFDEFVSDPRNAAKRELQYPMLDRRMWVLIYLARRLGMTGGLDNSLQVFADLIVDEQYERVQFSVSTLVDNGLKLYGSEESYVFLATIQSVIEPCKDLLGLQDCSRWLARACYKNRIEQLKYLHDVNDDEAYLIMVLLQAAKNMSSRLYLVNVSDWNQPIMGMSLEDLQPTVQEFVREEIGRCCREAHVYRVNGEHCSHDALEDAYGEYFGISVFRPSSR